METVKSADGTVISYDRAGEGPALVVSVGAFGTRQSFAAPVLFLGGKNSPGWFQRSVADQAAATPGARLEMLDGYDHNVPPEVITPILIGFLAAHR